MSRRYVFGRFEVRPDERRVLEAGEPAALGARAFDLLLALIEHRDRVIGKDDLMGLVWPGMVVEENNLTVQISALRKLLGSEAISTVPGRGYRFTLVPDEPQAQTPTRTTSKVVDLSLPDKPSLAVLPFTNLSGDPEQEYFADGVVDEITTALSRVRAFFVIARQSSFTYKGKAVDVKQVGRELGVRYVLEGSVRRAGQRVRIVGQLIEAENGRHIWADRFEGRLNDIFELQDRVTESVVAAIEPNLKLAEIERASGKPTESLGAYDLCLRALPIAFVISSKTANDEALGYLHRAIAMDPKYSFAKGLCAWTYALRHNQGWSNAEEVRMSIGLAEEALADHHDDPATLTHAGHALAYAHRREEGLRALDRALMLNPNSSRTLMSAGWVRVYACDAKNAIEHFKRAIRLSPLDPVMGYVLSGLGLAYAIDGRIDDALATAFDALHEAPKFTSTHRLLAYCLVSSGKIEEAQDTVRSMTQLAPSFRVSDTLGRFPEPFSSRYRDALLAAGLPP